MNTKPFLLFFICGFVGDQRLLSAQAFDSGSIGSMGEFSPTVSTNLLVPPDGIFHFTSVNIPAPVVIGFIPNARNTPIYLLAQRNVFIGGHIELSGSSSVSFTPGRGGPGGFDGGFGRSQFHGGSDGQGPGGGRVIDDNARSAAFAAPARQNSNVYGNTLLVPIVGGSGGGGSSTAGLGGGGGGGAIVIASNTRITLNCCGLGNDSIVADGGGGGGAGGVGSGGAIRLVAPTVDGNARIRARPGPSSAFPGSPGRIRIDTLERHAWQNLILGESGEKWTVGSQMYVFPTNEARLDIVEAGGQTIPEGTNSVVTISLLPGESTNQVIKVKATGFTGVIPITVAVVPEAGPSSRFDGSITIDGGSPTVGSVNVVIPSDSFCNVSVWTR